MILFAKQFFISLLMLLFIGGCHLEQGKLHFDKLNLNPIAIYNMSPLETTIYCVAEGDMPSGKLMEHMHRQSFEQIESNPETADWGELVCLSLSEHATVTQMKETINVLLLVLATRNDLRGVVRGFRKILDLKVKLVEEIEKAQERAKDKSSEQRSIITSYEKQLSIERQATMEQAEKVKILEQQVRKLKEVELLLQPNKTTK